MGTARIFLQGVEGIFSLLWRLENLFTDLYVSHLRLV
jgi:hypothetical protein